MTTTSETETLLGDGLEPVPTPGTWVIDQGASRVAFSVRHLAVATVHGRFAGFDGQLEIGEDGRGRANGRVEVATVDTGVDLRDRRLCSAGCFDADGHPEMTFDGEIEPGGSGFAVSGALTIKGQTRPIELDGGVTAADADGVWIEVGGAISRRELGLNWSDLLDNGVPVVADRVKIALELRLMRAEAAPC